MRRHLELNCFLHLYTCTEKVRKCKAARAFCVNNTYCTRRLLHRYTDLYKAFAPSQYCRDSDCRCVVIERLDKCNHTTAIICSGHSLHADVRKARERSPNICFYKMDELLLVLTTALGEFKGHHPHGGVTLARDDWNQSGVNATETQGYYFTFTSRLKNLYLQSSGSIPFNLQKV